MTTDRIAIVGGTLIDGTGAAPRPSSALIVNDGRIEWIGDASDLPRSPDLEVVDVAGTFVIPGLLDANVHLLVHSDPEVLLRYEPGAYDELVLEAAQIALRAGVTTVFDTWGPLQPIKRVRDRIDAGAVVGSRIFCAGNIIGNGGPWTSDFFPFFAEAVSSQVVAEVNHEWEQGVGSDLTWMSAADVRARVRDYIATSGIDLVKYAASSHADSRFLALSPHSQRAIVEEAHAAGLTAQACAQTPEALLATIEAGVDLLQHGDVTGIYPMPTETLELIVGGQLPCVTFLYTERHTEAFRERSPQWNSNSSWSTIMVVKDANDRRLIDGGAKILLGNDMGVYGHTAATSRMWGAMHADMPDVPSWLGRSHIHWMQAAFERGMDPMRALQAATRNIAEAYGKLADLGTLESGKIADLLVLDGDPLAAPENYARISRLMKDGAWIARAGLPENPVLTRVRDNHVWVAD